jgi:CubicO group peptidase (beta-lactamase class C family)
MRTISTSVAIVCLLYVSVSTQALSPRPGGDAGRATLAAPARDRALTLSPERLARVEAFLQRYVDQGSIAGAVALVLQDGKVAYEKAVGWRDREAGTRMTADTVFRIASQTKAITSAAVLMLVEEGRVGLTDPVSRFIPEYARTTVAVVTVNGMDTVPARRQITIRDLLTHTAGIAYGGSGPLSEIYAAKGLGPAAGFGYYTADKDEPICDTMARLASLPFNAQPGDAFVYGYNTDILGCVVERASGMPLDAFFRTRITGPLKMPDTYFYMPTADRQRLAAVYTTTREGKAERAPDGARGQGHYVDGPRRSFAGGAGLLSTARDYARFLEMIRNGGELDGVRLLSPRTVKLMTTNQIGTLHSSDGLGFGLGFQTSDRFGANALDEVGAFGWAGAYGTLYRVDPSSGVTMLLMVQQLGSNATEVRRIFPATVYQALVDAR